MIQAARSGVQNIAEGSMASAVSKKTELKLTGVARASLEELRLDYEDFLRQRGLSLWRPDHPSLKRFKARRCGKVDDVLVWLAEEKNTAKRMDNHRHTRTNTDKTKTDRGSVTVGESPCQSVPDFCLVANAALSLLNLCCYLLDRQLASQADTFEKQGGFTERLYRIRKQNR